MNEKEINKIPTTQTAESGQVELQVMRKPIIYLNLTNGLEALPLFADGYKTIRIQSTACEQKRWDYILADLDNGLLFDLAIGKSCFIIDYTQRKKIPRALFQGVEWIKFVLNRVWLNKEYKPMVRGNDASKYFMEQYRLLNNVTLNKIKYYRKFINTEEINLIAVGRQTANDGNYTYYAELCKAYA